MRTTLTPAGRSTSPPGGGALSRRDLLRLGLAGAAGLALASCARGTESRPAAEGVVTLFNDNPTWADGFAKASAALQRRVGFTLAPRAVPNVSNYQQIVRMSAQTDSTADLVKWWNGYRLREVARVGVFHDLTPAWDNARSNGWVDDPTLQAAFSYQGRQYGVPLYKSYFVMFYSKKAFATLQEDVPATWDDLLRVIGKARKAGLTPIAAGGATSWESLIWFEQLVNGTDADFYRRLTAGEASYTDPTAEQAMSLWVDLYGRGAFSTPDISASDVPGQMKQGTTAMLLYGTWNTGAFVTAGLTDKDFGAFLVPAPSGKPVVSVESGGLMVSANAHKLDAALSVATAWLSTDVQRAWVGFLKDNSANPAALPGVGAVRDVVHAVAQQRPQQTLRYWEASPPALIEGNVQDLSAFMTNPSAGAARSTLASMQRRADKEWKVWTS